MTSNPMNIKTKNISRSESFVMKNENSVHTIIISVIFSESNNLVFFIVSIFFIVCESPTLFGTYVSDIRKSRMLPIKMIVRLIFIFKGVGLI